MVRATSLTRDIMGAGGQKQVYHSATKRQWELSVINAPLVRISLSTSQYRDRGQITAAAAFLCEGGEGQEEDPAALQKKRTGWIMARRNVI